MGAYGTTWTRPMQDSTTKFHSNPIQLGCIAPQTPIQYVIQCVYVCIRPTSAYQKRVVVQKSLPANLGVVCMSLERTDLHSAQNIDYVCISIHPPYLHYRSLLRAHKLGCPAPARSNPLRSAAVQ